MHTCGHLDRSYRSHHIELAEALSATQQGIQVDHADLSAELCIPPSEALMLKFVAVESDCLEGIKTSMLA